MITIPVYEDGELYLLSQEEEISKKKQIKILKEHDGMVIVLNIPKTVRSAVYTSVKAQLDGHPNAEIKPKIDLLSPEDYHITLFYFQDTGKMFSILQAAKLIELPSLKVRLGGMVRFAKTTKDGKSAIAAQIDAHEIQKFRMLFQEKLEALDVTIDDEHGFTPHMTIAYVPEDIDWLVRLPTLKFQISSFGVWVGDDKKRTYDLNMDSVMQFLPIKVDRMKGGPGSGHYGHAGRPGKRGGSLGSSVGSGTVLTRDDFREDGIRDTFDMYDHTAAKVAANWQVSKEDLDAWISQEQPGVQEALAPKTHEERKEAMAYAQIRGWGGSSGGTVASVVTEHIGDKIGATGNSFLGDGARKFMENNPDVKRAITSFGDAMYGTTQKWFADRGITSVKLFRTGLPNDPEKLFTSWAADLGGVRHGANRIYKQATVPVKNILSIAPTGYGTLVEREAVVLGYFKGSPVEGYESTFKQIKILKVDDKHVTAPSTPVNNSAFIVKRKKQV